MVSSGNRCDNGRGIQVNGDGRNMAQEEDRAGDGGLMAGVRLQDVFVC